MLDGAVEIASYGFLIIALEKTGRRRMLVFMLGLSGGALIISTICNVVGEGNERKKYKFLIKNFFKLI